VVISIVPQVRRKADYHLQRSDIRGDRAIRSPLDGNDRK
jgi:hypothetical protein